MAHRPAAAPGLRSVRENLASAHRLRLRR